MAKRIQGAKLVELAGADHIPYVGDSDALLDEVEEFLTGIRHGAEPDRILATVIFTDIVDSTKQAAEMGDRKWGELLQQHHVHCAKGVGAVPWPGGEHGGGLFPDRF